MADAKLLIIVGASTRAAAQSAVRSGFAPWCVDQFGDADLREIAQHVEVVDHWPDGILTALRNAPAGPLVYTGALENSVGLFGRSGLNELPCWLAGNREPTVRLVRDPVWLQQQLADAGLPALEIRTKLTAADSTARWLKKPLHSAAGFHIAEATAPAAESAGSYFQRCVAGDSVSALYLADGDNAELLGMCQQLHGEKDAGATGFLHCGSIGPLTRADLPDETFRLAQIIGRKITSLAGVRGLFGIDFILGDDPTSLWTLEVNPRWPASAEIIERTHHWPLMSWHLAAAEDTARLADTKSGADVDHTPYHWGETAESWQPCRREEVKWGRVVVYSPRRLCVTNEIAGLQTTFFDGQIEVADTPLPGVTIEAGHPVCTLLTSSISVDSCRERLLSAASVLRGVLSE